MNELKWDYDYLVNTIKGQIKVCKQLVKEFTEDAEEHKERGFDFGEGQCRGLVLANRLVAENLERSLKHIGEMIEDDTQRASIKSLT